MKPSKGKRKLRQGMEDITSQFQKVIEHHTEKINNPEVTVSRKTIMIGAIPHLVVLALTCYIVWMARPASSE